MTDVVKLTAGSPTTAPGRGARKSAQARRADLAAIIAMLSAGLLLHRGWLSRGTLAYGDWLPLSGDRMLEFLRPPQAWNSLRVLGEPNSSLSGAAYELVIGGLAWLGLSYDVIERAVFFLPAAVLPFVSMYALAGRFATSRVARLVAGIVYGSNSYILIVSTNQMTVAVAYAVVPFAIRSALALNDTERVVPAAVRTGLWVALAAAYDPRIGLLALALVLTAAASVGWRRAVRGAALILITVVAFHLYWILPLVVVGRGEAFEGLLPIDPFRSFANWQHALFLNHPFWTGAVPTAFEPVDVERVAVLYPLIGVAAVLLAPRDYRARAAWAAGLVLVGSLLVKGENPPWREFYGWTFDHVPGMQLFRDMSKFYVLVALGYALLAGMLLEWAMREARISGAAAARFLAPVASCVIALPVFVTLHPALTQRLGGATRPVAVPSAAERVEARLRADRDFSRVVWVPGLPTFAYQTEAHPPIRVPDIAVQGVPADPFELLERGDLDRLLSLWTIGYVVVDRLASAGAWPESVLDPNARGTQLLSALESRPYLEVVQQDDLVVFKRRSAASAVAANEPVLYDSGRRAPPSQIEPEWQAPSLVAVDRPELERALAELDQSDAVVGAMLRPRWAEAAPGDNDVTVPIDIPVPGPYAWSSAVPVPGDSDVTVTVTTPGGAEVWRAEPRLNGDMVDFNSAGLHYVKFASAKIQTATLVNPSFEEGPWVGLGDAHNYDGSPLSTTGIVARTVPRGSGRALLLQARRHVAGIGQEIDSFEPGAAYLASFSWQRRRGLDPSFGLYFGEFVKQYREELNGPRGWNRRSVVVTPPSGSNTLGIAFYSGPGVSTYLTQALFDDVRLLGLAPWIPQLGLELASEPRVSNVDNVEGRGSGVWAAEVRPEGGAVVVVRSASRCHPGWGGRFVEGGRRARRRELRAVHVCDIGGHNAWVVAVPEGLSMFHAETAFSGQPSAIAGGILSMSAAVAAFFASARVGPRVRRLLQRASRRIGRSG